jgi:hypothetical protein
MNTECAETCRNYPIGEHAPHCPELAEIEEQLSQTEKMADDFGEEGC